MHKYTKDCCGTCMRKCENLNVEKIKSKIYRPPTINKIELENEFDNTEFSKAINRTIVRANLLGAGKTTNIIKYYQSINKKILVVCLQMFWHWILKINSKR